MNKIRKLMLHSGFIEIHKNSRKKYEMDRRFPHLRTIKFKADARIGGFEIVMVVW